MSMLNVNATKKKNEGLDKEDCWNQMELLIYSLSEVISEWRKL